jgi:two-component system response regulator FixJ
MPAPHQSPSVIHIIDDDADVRDSLQMLIESAGHRCDGYDSAEAFLAQADLDGPGCALIDVRMPGMDGLALQRALKARGSLLPVIFMTGFGQVATAVAAMKEGAVDFVEKPCARDVMLAAIERALASGAKAGQSAAEAKQARMLVEALTPREHDVLRLMVAGKANKVIAHELQISPRTVEIHRARVMEKLAARSLSDVVRIALTAGTEMPSA